MPVAIKYMIRPLQREAAPETYGKGVHKILIPIRDPGNRSQYAHPERVVSASEIYSSAVAHARGQCCALAPDNRKNHPKIFSFVVRLTERKTTIDSLP